MPLTTPTIVGCHLPVAIGERSSVGMGTENAPPHPPPMVQQVSVPSVASGNLKMGSLGGAVELPSTAHPSSVGWEDSYRGVDR
jgi:hypothetical protein